MPPKRKRKDVKHITLRFILNGTVPSKKNRQRVRNNLWNIKASMIKKGGTMSVQALFAILSERLKFWMQPDEAYTEWRGNVKPIMKEQQSFWENKYKDYGLVFPLTDVSIKIYHYWADNRKRDLSNKIDSICDMLVDNYVIQDDSWQVVGMVTSEGEGYFGQITDHITTIDVTVRV
jgi:Holliday junction resolvase RusA-like endonuclease